MARHTNSLRSSCQRSFSRKIRTNIRERPARSRRQNIAISSSQVRKSRPECRGKLNKRFSRNNPNNKNTKKRQERLIRTLLAAGITLAVLRRLTKKNNPKNNPRSKTKKRKTRRSQPKFGIYSSPRDLTSSRKPKKKFTGLNIDFDV